jgi:hypothetical protein
MATDFKRLIILLQEELVEFIVIGGVAMVAHGSAYATFDLDLCYRRTPENIERLCRALAGHDPRLRGAPKDLPFRFEAPTVQRGLNFTLATDIGDLDLLGEVAGLGLYDAVLKESQMREVFGKKCLVLSLAGLIKTKQAAGRKKDLMVLPELEGLNELRKKIGQEE